MKIAIDIGSSNSKLINETFGITSHQLNTKLVDLLKANLSDCEVVVLSASSEQHLAELTEQAKATKCISISYSTHNGLVGGSETFFARTAGGSKLGKQLHKAVIEVLGLRDRGTNIIETPVKVPYVRLHLGFIDHDVDVMVIESNLSNLAKAIAQVLQ